MKTAGKMALCAGVVAGLATAASADFTWSAFNPSPSGVSTTWRNQDLLSLGSAPAGQYGSFEVLVDWVGGGGSAQWSSEARVHFSSLAASGTATTPSGVGTAYTSGARSPLNGASSGNDVMNMRFAGILDNIYSGGDPLFLNFRQTFSGTNANWSNVRVTFFDYVPPTPPASAIDLGTFNGSMTHTQGYTSNTVQWYKFTLATPISSSDLLRIDTLGTSLAGGQFGANDTHMALYNAAGNVVAMADDINTTTRESMLVYGNATGQPVGATASTLAAGEYYIAASAYRLVAEGAFAATAIDSVAAGVEGVTGTIQVNVVPAPGALALAGIGGLIAARRRRA